MVILRQTVVELYDSLLIAEPILRTLCSIQLPFYSRPVAAIEVISNRFIRLSIVDKTAEFGDP